MLCPVTHGAIQFLTEFHVSHECYTHYDGTLRSIDRELVLRIPWGFPSIATQKLN